MDISTYLSQRLGLAVQNLNLNDVMLSKQTLNVEQLNRYLSVVGGAIQIKVKADATAD
jgi:hypothetical protein